MPGTTGKGVPYSLGTDAASTIDNTMQSLAEWVDGRPGVAPLSTAQRDALAGADLWDGRVIWNNTLAQLERYSAGSAKWLPIFNVGTTLRSMYTFTLQDFVQVNNAANDYYIVPFFVEVPPGQTITLRAVNLRVLTGSVDFALDRRAADGVFSRIGTYTADTTYARSTVGFPVTLANLDTIHLIVTRAAPGSRGLTASIAYDMSV